MKKSFRKLYFKKKKETNLRKNIRNITIFVVDYRRKSAKKYFDTFRF